MSVHFQSYWVILHCSHWCSALHEHSQHTYQSDPVSLSHPEVSHMCEQRKESSARPEVNQLLTITPTTSKFKRKAPQVLFWSGRCQTAYILLRINDYNYMRIYTYSTSSVIRTPLIRRLFRSVQVSEIVEITEIILNTKYQQHHYTLSVLLASALQSTLLVGRNK